MMMDLLGQLNSEMLFLIAAVMVSLSVIVIVIALRSLRSKDDDLSARLEVTLQNTTGTVDGDDDSAPAAQIARRINESINQRSFAREISRELEQANLPLTVPEWILVRIAVPLVMGLLAMLIWRSVLILPVALIVGFLAPMFWLNMLRNRRNNQFAEQLAETLTMLSGALRGGFSLAQAMRMAAKESPEPTRSELSRVGQEVQIGLSLSDALDNLTRRMESEDLDLVVSAIKINARVGGNLTEILDSISTTIRERSKLRREVRVITSMQRLSAYIIGFLPFGLALIIFAINPEYMLRLFEPGLILCIPIGAFVFAVVGFLLIRRIADIKV
jgi:tight adherence protein B